MPIYEYRCGACKGIVETIQTLDAEAPVCCGLPMDKRPTSHAMFKMRGMGGGPNLRKATQGSRYDRSEPGMWV